MPTDLNRIAKELNLRLPYNLWHAVLFYTSSELTRRALARRGVTNYKPVILGMYDRGFRNFRQSLEIRWQAYLDGKISRQEALRRIVTETGQARKS